MLHRNGRNLANLISVTRNASESTVARVGRYLEVITRNIRLGKVLDVGSHQIIQFQVQAKDRLLEFDASAMSDGTLRALAALMAAFQTIPPFGSPSLIAIEEPETALHPAATHALVDALDEATLRTQILLTTHSPEMLDNPTIRPTNVRVVQMIDGATVIGPVDEASVEILRRDLDTLGGLERQNQLEVDLDDQERQQRLAQNGREEGT